MLRSYRVANHRSIRDEQELVLLPAYDKARAVVPVAAIFGANASGKSNLLDGLAFMQQAVRSSFRRWEAGTGIPRTRFKLDPKTEAEPSFYAVDMLLDGVQHAYGFSVDSERVVEEWLYSYPHRRKRVIFERNGDEISFGSTVPDYRAVSELLSGLTRGNSLVLSAAAQANQGVVAPTYAWFRDSLKIVGREAHPEVIDTQRLKAVIDSQPSVIELIKAADLGIRDVGLTPPQVDSEILQELADARKALVNAQEQRRQAGPNVGAIRMAELTADQAEWRYLRAEREAARPPQLVFRHGDAAAPLTVEDQSDGTVAWIGLLIEAAEALQIGAVVLVDEIDASLHPHLTARLIGLFQDDEVNTKGAQLILTTHDASLLSPVLGDETLARDQVWFIEKNADGASRLYPLTDFHPRQGENTARRYLGGSYGAIPSTSEYAFRRAMLRQDFGALAAAGATV